ncbi:MAG: LysM domain-containing protein [Deltaproteobacteria bacterium]|jgi:hypothetical protein|nr:LysM domain-containing protein [Deltaproteobacteria bacterium]
MSHFSFMERIVKRAAPLGLAFLSAVFLLLGQGCVGVSDEDLENIRLENEALEAELVLEKSRADILNRALTNVYKERDRLSDLLNNPPPPPPSPDEENEADAPDQAQAADQRQARTYVVKKGETLGGIARRHRTTAAALIRLNPFLETRPNNMIWENDKLTLPR